MWNIILIWHQENAIAVSFLRSSFPIFVSHSRNLKEIVMMDFGADTLQFPLFGGLVKGIPHGFASMSWEKHTNIWFAVIILPILKIFAWAPSLGPNHLGPSLICSRAVPVISQCQFWSVVVLGYVLVVWIPRFWNHFCRRRLFPVKGFQFILPYEGSRIP